MNKYLHFSVVFKASNLNYGEGVGNILALKKITSEGKQFSYISRQALRYDIVRMLEEFYGFRRADVSKEAGVIQFAEDATIRDFPELDFFGYMKTQTNKIRKAVVRLTDAVSLEPFKNELEFATNKGLADRIPGNVGNDIFQSEIHRSYYCYSLTCNLEEVGVDGNYGISLELSERSKRVKSLLDVVRLLYRDIRGKRENLSPIFVIGGLYDVGNPFFYNRIKLHFTRDKVLINEGLINSTLNIKTLKGKVSDYTFLGYVDGEFSNIDAIGLPDDRKLSVEDFFEKIKDEVDKFYASG